MIPESLTFKRFQIYGLRDGFFSLDGGAMFGVIPKTLWEKKYPADEHNRIKLGLNSILIRTEDKNVLVETGMGTHQDSKFNEFYSLDLQPGLVETLKDVGLEREDIDYVINTHLHFDHCGGNTFIDLDGEVVPTFPHAEYVIQKGEWESACHPNPRDRSSYLEKYFRPLEDHKQLHLVEGNTQIIEGVEVLLSPGHTAFHQCVKIESEGRVLFFLGDMVPTSGHVGLPYVMSYDLFPLQTMLNKEKFYELAIEENWTMAFNHDPEFFFGKVGEKNGKFIFCPLSSE
ncbi:MAG: MBL fold metallo-hydrolase [Candidatus Aminicenantes bacterium]|nr:MBL fold metallo-hydrolase [Candidatus Aminicenantes bacterium]